MNRQFLSLSRSFQCRSSWLPRLCSWPSSVGRWISSIRECAPAKGRISCQLSFNTEKRMNRIIRTATFAAFIAFATCGLRAQDRTPPSTFVFMKGYVEHNFYSSGGSPESLFSLLALVQLYAAHRQFVGNSA